MQGENYRIQYDCYLFNDPLEDTEIRDNSCDGQQRGVTCSTIR